MTDRRLTPANARAALASLRGIVDAPRYVVGEAARVAVPLVDLNRAPDGPRDRQLLLGDAVTLIDRHEGWAFLQAAKDGYCGYVPETALGGPRPPTHRVIAPATHVYSAPKVQAPEVAALSFGSLLTVTGMAGPYAETPDGFVCSQHLRPVSELLDDPLAVAMLFLGTPYLWGGNSRAGIDCSGLVQAALLACGIACPGDSDLQAQSVGRALLPDELPVPGDLIFWQGHVAMVADAGRIIHATAYRMAVIVEDMAAAVARIAGLGLPVLARRRP
ncbi:MAG: C40 family peptidase [Rhodobacter sp.]|nr:C40 family peptidase [Rhodobacter sp.]